MKYPIKITFKSEIIPLLFLVLTVGLSFYFYAHFPAQVASHWNFAGEVDNYSSKAVGAFAIPAMLIGIYVLFLVLPLFDPKKDRYPEFEKPYTLFRTLFIGFLSAIYIATGIFNMGYSINIGRVIPILIGILFVLIGNYMGILKYNWFVGIRTPWSMSSENVWNKTHRFGGIFFMLFGIVIAVTPFLPKAIGIYVFMVGVVSMLVGSFGISYYFYRQEKNLK